ncbi:uncharacterized protein TM35_000071470 [Trypanosoma theileri]|uniref:Uncharacterized protein n=1 Tax=Trypanosoma theileri TaxID=67003 RepID=A0A1X0P1Z1_9TRYP|nr:uncharacterized protein TM35_000071470 [Trypanosoma theileri]ORC90723.1 hypothetical protein TM35_000071470 [Trypanosoma theileri]
MDAIKGLARRTTQSIREKVTHTETSPEDEMLDETSKKVRQFQKTSEVLCVKLIRAASLIEELGKLVKDIGEEYQKVPDLQPDAIKFADDVLEVGNKLIATAQEHQKGLKTQGFDVLNSFMKEVKKLKDAEDTRRKNQLEYDFFRRKVLELRRDPPKDTSRIPRNEQTLENWRVELWRATENNKAICSNLYAEGQRGIDLSVLTLTQVLGSYLGIAGGGFKQQFVNARLPVYPTGPILPPAPLPPNPLPPYQPPLQPGGYGSATYGQPPQPQQGWQQSQPPYAQPTPPAQQQSQNWHQQQQQQQQQQGYQQGHVVQQQKDWTQSQQSWQQPPPTSVEQHDWGQPQPSQSQQQLTQPQVSISGGWQVAEQPVEWKPTPQSLSSSNVTQTHENKLWTLTPIVDEHFKGNGNGNVDGNGNSAHTS